MPSEFARQEWLGVFWRAVRRGVAGTELPGRAVSQEAWLAAFWRSYNTAVTGQRDAAGAATPESAADVPGQAAVGSTSDWELVEDERETERPAVERLKSEEQPKDRQQGSGEWW